MRALFVRAPGSPGAVYGFLQRRWGREPLDLLLSDAVNGWRALVGEGQTARDWMEAAGPALSRAFPPAVTLLWAEAAAWGFCVWPEGGPEERGGGAREPEARRGLLRRLLPPAGKPSSPEAAWAAGRGLPVERVLDLAGRRPPPILDWAIVAGLVERGLLVEAGPRFYRLRFG